MKQYHPIHNLRSLTLILLVICSYTLSGCGGPATVPQSPEPSTTGAVTSPPPLPTPTVDVSRARKAFEAGGELTYSEIVALYDDLVGDQLNSKDYKDSEAAYAAELDFKLKEYNFGWQLAKCRLKESIGWVASWRNEYDKDYKDIPGLVRLYILMYDPYSPALDDNGYDEMIIANANKKAITAIKYGQRIRFSGDLTNDRTVKNATYQLLEDDFTPPTPSPDELKDLHITLNRTMCFGSCPDYTLTITGDGKVSFEGRHSTRVTGTATTTIDQSKLVELVKEFRRADFFNLQDNYHADVTDAASQAVTIQLGGKTKRVENYAAGPQRLYLLQDRIDQIVNSDQWIK